LVLAMHNYQGEHGRLPPAAVCDRYGKPILSWRVLLLPYISQEELFREFNLEEPWDSEHNIRLLPRMPSTYAPPSGKRKRVPDYHTVCHVFVGRGTAFEGTEGLRLDKDFDDGTSNTVLVIEAGEPVPWTKPEEISFDPDKPLPPLRRLFKDMVRVGMADGTVGGIFPDKLSPRTLRSAIMRNDGEPLGSDWWGP
jgi:hypothetical protein